MDTFEHSERHPDGQFARLRGRARPGGRAARWALAAWLLLAGVAIGTGCPSDSSPPEPAAPADRPAVLDDELSPNARPDIYEMLVADRERPRSPADGGGRAWLVSATPIGGAGPGAALVAGTSARFELVYEAGPLGVAEDGAIYLQASPFWGWDTPQVEVQDAPGYTTLGTTAEGVQLQARTVDQGLLQIGIGGRALRAGERVQLTYGAGPAGARVDRFAERGERLFFAVDGDGDGVRSLLAESPRVDIVAGPAARLQLVLPTTVRPRESATLRVVWLDALGSAGVDFTGEVELAPPPADVHVDSRVSFAAADAGVRAIPVRADREGVVRLRARARVGPGDGEDAWTEAESNPMLVSASAPRILWGDLHGHSQLSDGTGRPDDYFRYARDVAGLDVAALTDHDHWGLRALDDRPDLWEQIREAVRAYHEPGRFVTILGYEWTSWLHGHRHVLHFADDGPLWSSLDPETTTPEQLWRAIGERGDLTFAHHSAGAPIATNWSFRPPPEIEPVTEVVSVHGSSEALDSPERINDPQPGNFVRDVLDDGMRFGFIGSGDSHDGHPGFTQIASAGRGGLAAIFAEEKTRDAVRNALLARRCYATSGPRIWMRTALDGHPMGSLIPPDASGAKPTLEVAVLSPGPLDRIDVVRSGALAVSVDAEGEREFSANFEMPPLASGEYLYVRAVQRDGGAAWSSPFYIGE